MEDGRDFWWHECIADEPNTCDSEVMDSEDLLFILYTLLYLLFKIIIIILFINFLIFIIIIL